MKIARHCTYYESYLPTPRHRVPRQREVQGIVTAEIREVTGADAPVAIVHTGGPGHKLFPIHRDRGLWDRLEYRLYDGKLYTTLCRSAFCCYDDYKHVGRQRATVRDIAWRDYGRADLETRQRDFAERMSQYLLVDGVLHAEIGEPRYVIMTFGLGCNHGGTALMVDHHFNPNIVTEAYFRADEEAEAREAAMVVAVGRGDTNDLPDIAKRRYDRFEILIPEAITMDREARPDTVDSFSARLTAITNAGMPPAMGAIAVLAEAVRP